MRKGQKMTEEQRRALGDRVRTEWSDPEKRKRRMRFLVSEEGKECFRKTTKGSWDRGERKRVIPKEVREKISKSTIAAMANPEIRRKSLDGILNLWKTQYARMCAVRKKQAQDPERRRAHSECMKKLWKSKEYREKATKTRSSDMKKRWKSDKYRQEIKEMLTRTREKRLEKHRRWLDNNPLKVRELMDNAKSYLSKYDSRPQRAVIEMMKSNGLWCGFEAELPVNRIHVDIGNPDKKIAIEVDGCFWHCCKKCGFSAEYPAQKKTLAGDSWRNSFLLKNGWSLLRIWQHSIEGDSESVLEAVRGIVSRVSSGERVGLIVL
jgi:DNA mismatch endonuclease (patch repair protein)